MYVIISIGTSLPVNQTNHTWPCQRDQNVRRELSEAQHKSLELSDIITDLGKNMSSRWPMNPYKASNTHFFGPPRKTVVKPQQVLDENIRVVKAFISLMRNSTKQLSHLKLGEKLMMREGMNRIKRLAYALVQRRLPRILIEMKQGSRGKRTSGLRRGRQMNNTDIKPQTPLALTKPSSITSIHGSTTVQDFVFRTQIILTDFSTNVLDLVSDLRNIAKQSCY
ncbi:unnamed protein product [Pocillopora meandrina]|uniref:Uncharacterized protein n=1 Tax=Pocillopora meandrina TaxID=46732 RepID=A0AAU9XAB0_9CNID|nr:unnamed protein product [Pocillopora meandrina]